MHSNGTAAVGQGKSPAILQTQLLSKETYQSFLEIANLHLNDHGPMNPPGFEAFGEEPPPAPKLDNKGIIAMDITAQFTAAAESMSNLLQLDFDRSRADRYQSSMWDN